MSIKTTKYVTRTEAIDLLVSELPNLKNKTVEDLLDFIADSDEGRRVSRFDNFLIEGEYFHQARCKCPEGCCGHHG